MSWKPQRGLLLVCIEFQVVSCVGRVVLYRHSERFVEICCLQLHGELSSTPKQKLACS